MNPSISVIRRYCGGVFQKNHYYYQRVITNLKTFTRTNNNNNNRLNYSNLKQIMANTNRENPNFFQFTNYDCIGFDLDNTLARYCVGAMMEMEYKILSNFMVEKKNYNPTFLLKPLDHQFIIKGLIVDSTKGNLLRISGDGTIIQAAHGTTILNQEAIKEYYPDFHWNPTDKLINNPLVAFDGGSHTDDMRLLLDYYDVVASLIYARAVDSLQEDSDNHRRIENIWPDLLDGLKLMFDRKNYLQRRGEYFEEMQQSPQKYYHKCSAELIKWLKTLREMNKTLFLITSSNVDFATHTATNTLGINWRELFDIVICYAQKPHFFTSRADFIDLDGFNETRSLNLNQLNLGGIYNGGNWTDLHEFLKINYNKTNLNEPRFLYIGDNLIHDIYTPNVHGNCETVAVCEELEAEGVFGHEKWHPDEEFLCSSIWGSYFKCKNSGKKTNWYNLMKNHSKFFIPSLEYVAKFPIDHKFQFNHF